LLWWSPDPRAVLPLDGFHESRSLRRVRRRFRITRNAAFGAVIRACAVGRGETWITPEIVAAYERLHAMGWVHSVEAWAGDTLAGGVYGVAVGGLFAAESMFHHVRDASKVALAALVDELSAAGFVLLDVQLRTDHLASLGVVEIPRDAYLTRVAAAIALRTAWS
jgi:leucyl/phenylalanyl-tRNA--protein transferase